MTKRILLVVLWSASVPTYADGPKGVTFNGERFLVRDGSLSFTGVVIKPTGKGPFPAVLVSHGLGGLGESFGRQKARDFGKWGFVVISPNYAHVQGGERKDFGASAENIGRAKKCLDILQSMPDVDPKRLYAYGNSMGAFLTIGLAAEDKRLVAAAITAGGLAPQDGHPAPSRERALRIKTPFCILHGSDDTTVPPNRSQWLELTLKENGVPYERKVFEGVGHDLHASKAREVNAMIEKWFKKYAKKKDEA